ncbi:hypothetical protein FRB94_003567 [Tulasnella sp. JGI-2019a]|nr:hypothetical protein FRB93_002602 [Tulasnella sp. JGI-2019a]KAG9013127.1 hypothetical protein FRB94_003567 [Tulasnella sp. JGI-2019a]KAG9025688.1 hypothetical protein FRB95_009905 [Tulasnella sp. JGI-2019a]
MRLGALIAVSFTLAIQPIWAAPIPTNIPPPSGWVEGAKKGIVAAFGKFTFESIFPNGLSPASLPNPTAAAKHIHLQPSWYKSALIKFKVQPLISEGLRPQALDALKTAGTQIKGVRTHLPPVNNLVPLR